LNRDNEQNILHELAGQFPSEFQIIDFLGEGGQGLVVKAYYAPLQRDVALKIIKDVGAEGERQIKRLKNEAIVLAKLKHPNIVQLFQMGECKDGTPFLVCEYLEGITLTQYLQKTPQPDPKTIFEVFQQILDALSCAHENGLLHRDLKPSNIMLIPDEESKSSTVKLLDFGIARNIEENTPQHLSNTVQVTGSAPYMSPEQCRGEELDARSDLYSVACILYQCLAGLPPFVGETPIHTRYMHLSEEAKMPPTDVFANTAGRSAVYKLVLRALSKDKTKRPASASEFARLLNEAMPKAAQRTGWTPAKQANNKAKILASILGTLAIFFIGAIVRMQLPSKQKLPSISKGAPAGSKIARHSKTAQLRQILDELKKEKTISTVERQKLIEQLSSFVASLNTNDNPLAVIGLQRKAMLEQVQFVDRDIAIQTWNKALNLCKDETGKETRDALLCYAKISENLITKGDLQGAEQMINKALALAEELRKQSRGLDVPELVDERGGLCVEELYANLGQIAFNRKQFQKAADLYKEAELEDRTNEDEVKATRFLVAQVNCLLKLGKRKFASELIEKRIKLISKNYSRELPYAGHALKQLKEIVKENFPELEADFGAG
jgi:serine/threonine protein kinase